MLQFYGDYVLHRPKVYKVSQPLRYSESDCSRVVIATAVCAPPSRTAVPASATETKFGPIFAAEPLLTPPCQPTLPLF